MGKTLFGASISILFHFLDLFASVGSPLPKNFIGKLATGDARPKGSCVFIYRVNPSNKSFFKFCSVYLLFCRILWQHLLNKIIGSAEALPEVPRGHDFWYIYGHVCGIGPRIRTPALQLATRTPAFCVQKTK